MSADPIAKFISVVDVHFPKPRFISEDIEDAWIASMVKFLAPYDAAVLNRAAEHILKTRDPKKDGKWFPVPSEIIAVCDLMQRAIQLEAAPPLLSHGRKDQSEWAGWRVELADDLIKTQMGHEASKRGWIGSLWSFCRRFARLPDAREVSSVKADAAKFDEDLEMCERGEAGPNSKLLAELGRKMKARRDEKAAIAIGEGRANG